MRCEPVSFYWPIDEPLIAIGRAAADGKVRRTLDAFSLVLKASAADTPGINVTSCMKLRPLSGNLRLGWPQ